MVSKELLDEARVGTLATTIIATTVVLIVIALFTDLQLVLHHVMLTLALAAFWPFVLAAAILFVIMAAVMLSLAPLAVFDGGEVSGAVAGEVVAEEIVAENVTELGSKIGEPYYNWLLGIRHPVFWGVPAGLALGCLLIWGYLAVFIFPLESDTLEAFAEGQEHIEKHYEEEGGFPRPDDDGLLVMPDGETLTDGFGQPIRYEVEGRWRVASWQLQSAGSDGEFGTRSDLCAEGATGAVETTRAAAELVERFTDAEPTRQELIQGVVEMRCE